MQIKLRKGLKILVPAQPGDTVQDYTYVVERIIKRNGKMLVEVRTERQRCSPRGLVGPTTWEFTDMQAQFQAGTMRSE